jgi:hypothetical protein
VELFSEVKKRFFKKKIGADRHYDHGEIPCLPRKQNSPFQSKNPWV